MTDPISIRSSPEEPLCTPPPSPHFNPLVAGHHCASIEGVIRFSDIEGLGVPPDFDIDEREDEEALAIRGERDADGQRKGPKWTWWKWK
jgi:hypothetical protein